MCGEGSVEDGSTGNALHALKCIPHGQNSDFLVSLLTQQKLNAYSWFTSSPGFVLHSQLYLPTVWASLLPVSAQDALGSAPTGLSGTLVPCSSLGSFLLQKTESLGPGLADLFTVLFSVEETGTYLDTGRRSVPVCH